MLKSARILIFLALFVTGCEPAYDTTADFMLPVAKPIPLSPCRPKPCANPALPACAPTITVCEEKEYPLSTLVDMGLSNSPLTREAWANARSAAAELGVANSAFFPDINITWTATRQQPAAPVNAPLFIAESPAYTTYSPQLTVSYLLWDFGGRISAMDNARETLLAARWNYSWTIQTVMFSIIQSYYNYLAAIALLQANEDTLRDAKLNLQSAEATFTAGLNTIVDVLQAKAQMLSAELAVVSQKGALETAKATLLTNIGLKPDAKLKVAKPQDRAITQVKCDIERILKEASCCRADLEGLRAGIRAQKATVVQDISGLWPTITGSFSGGRTFFHNFGSDKHDFIESITLNIPVFSGFSQVNTIRQAEAEVESLIAGFKSQELQAQLAVVTNYFAVRTATESFQYSKDYLRYAQEAYNAALLGYRAGTNTILNVFQATATLSNARSSFINSQYSWYIALSNLVYARGALISNELKTDCEPPS